MITPIVVKEESYLLAGITAKNLLSQSSLSPERIYVINTFSKKSARYKLYEKAFYCFDNNANMELGIIVSTDPKEKPIFTAPQYGIQTYNNGSREKILDVIKDNFPEVFEWLLFNPEWL